MHTPAIRWTQPPRASDPPMVERAPRILMVDGGAHFQHVVGPALRGAGYELINHSSADRLVNLLEDVQPDLLLLDTALSEVSGFELCGELRATEIGRQTPIMLVAARELDEEVVARGLLCGADDFCIVPDRLLEFLARVRVQLRNKRDRDRLRRMRTERDGYRREAIVDSLTGIPNRRSVEASIDSALAEGTRFAVLFFDIDHFKSVNDTLGHDAGDVVLQAVATCLHRSTRGGDRCGRFGGEEFVVVATDVGADIATSIGERHRKAVEALVVPVLGTRKLTVSVGIAFFDPQNPDANTIALVHRADLALYEAKRGGRNRVVMASPAIEISGLCVVPRYSISDPVISITEEMPPSSRVQVSALEEALIEKLSTGIAGLPILPEAAAEALRLAGDARTDVAKIARLVDRDPPLAARFVALAGSAVYSARAARATSTHQALVRIGLAAARDLLFQVVCERSSAQLPRYQEAVAASFRRSVRAAIATRNVAKEFAAPFPYAYLAGLLHDIGEARVYRILAHLPDSPIDATLVAGLVARYHNRAGATVAEAWKLPPEIVEVCTHHHDALTGALPHVKLVMAGDALVRIHDDPTLLEEETERLVSMGVRVERVPHLIRGLATTAEELET